MRSVAILCAAALLGLAHALPTPDAVVPESLAQVHNADGGICDHVDPQHEPCCSKTDRHEQNTCILDKNPDFTADKAAEHCAHHSPQEEPCCGLSDHTAQAACAAVTHGSNGGGSSGDDAGICDHVSPSDEQCCSETDRHTQHTCIINKHPQCDHISPDDNACCQKTDYVEQAECLVSEHCDNTSPDEDPCCGLTDRAAQAACAAVTHGQHSSGHNEPSEECKQCIMTCPYWQDHGCSPGSESDDCTMDKVEQNCGGVCGTQCSDGPPPCEGLEDEVKTIMTDHGLGDTSSLPAACGACLNSANNDGCGLDHKKIFGTSGAGSDVVPESESK